MTTNIERAARALYDHRLTVGDFPDGVTEWKDLPDPWKDEWREAADFLGDRGLLAEDLPEPYVVAGVGDADVTAWQPCHTIMRTDFTGGAASEVEIPAGNVWIEHDSIVAFDVDHSEMHLGTGEARELALAILAALQHMKDAE